MVWLVKAVWNQRGSRVPDRCAPKQQRFAYVSVECKEWSDAERLVRFHRRYRTADVVTVIGTWTDVVGLLVKLGDVTGGHRAEVRAAED